MLQYFSAESFSAFVTRLLITLTTSQPDEQQMVLGDENSPSSGSRSKVGKRMIINDETTGHSYVGFQVYQRSSRL